MKKSKRVSSVTDMGIKTDLGMFLIERELEKKVISDIRIRQKNIPGLRQDELGYIAIWGQEELTPGCKACLSGRWTQLRTTSRCNLNCSFCYYFVGNNIPHVEIIPPDIYLINNRFFTESDIKLLFEVQAEKYLSGVAWLHFEPLLELEKILPLMKFIHRKGYHQWLYTNGVYATQESLKKLADAGLNEIRFNLAATNCSNQAIKNMRVARRYFKYLCIESPMFTEFYNSFLKKKNSILDTGVDHIHFAELQLFPKTKDNFKQEGIIYRYRKGYVSTIRSRQLTYNIFAIAAKEKWKNILLHDCSNETKFYRGIQYPFPAFGQIMYAGQLMLEQQFFKDAIKYLKTSKVRTKLRLRKLPSENEGHFIDPHIFYDTYLKVKHREDELPIVTIDGES